MSHAATWSSRPLYRSRAAVVTSSSGRPERLLEQARSERVGQVQSSGSEPQTVRGALKRMVRRRSRQRIDPLPGARRCGYASVLVGPAVLAADPSRRSLVVPLPEQPLSEFVPGQMFEHQLEGRPWSQASLASQDAG